MASHSRNRSRDSIPITGSATWVDPSTSLPPSYKTFWTHENNIDVVGNRSGVNPWDYQSQDTYLWTVNGQNKVSNSLAWLYNDYPGGSATGFPPWADGAPSLSRALVSALARTNPNRAKVDTPVFLFELRDIPRMIRDWGNDILVAKNWLFTELDTHGHLIDLRTAPRRIANNYLAYQYGIAPFISDLQKMLDVVGSVDKKLSELKHLKQGSSRRHATVFNAEKSENRVTRYISGLYQESNSFSSYFIQTKKVWVSVNWKPLNPSSLPKTDDELRELARRLAFGWEFSLAQLWEAMPWSWLFDWFGNIGDIFNASRNTIPCEWSESAIMTERILRLTGFSWVTHVGPVRVSVPNYHYRILKRELAPIVVYPEFNLPIFDGRQLSILSALGVQRSGAK